MKKVLFNLLGGMPLDSDDFDVFLGSIYSAIGHLGIGIAGEHADPNLSFFTPPEAGVFVILRGGKLSYVGSSVSGTLSWTKGWALYNGELREIRPGSAAVTWGSTTGVQWIPVTENSGTETFQDSSVKDTYRDEYLTVQVATAPLGPGAARAWKGVTSTSGQTEYFVADRMAEQVYDRLKNYVATKGDPFVPVTPGANWVPTSIANGLSVRKNMDGTVTVVGSVALAGAPVAISGAAAQIATGLPKLLDFNTAGVAALFHPVNAFEGLLGTTQRACSVRIDTDGILTYIGDPTPVGTFIMNINFTYPYNPLI